MGRLADGAGLAARLDAGPLAEAPAAIEDLSRTPGTEDKAALRAELVATLEERFAQGIARRDWFEPLLGAPAPERPSHDSERPASAIEVDRRLRCLLRSALEDMAPEERSSRVAVAARSAEDISLLCAMILEIGPERDGSPLGDALPDWKTVLLDRIGALAAARTLWAQRDPAALLWFWFVHGESERVYLFTRRAMDEPRGLAALLAILLDRVGTGEGAQEIVAVRRWSRIIDFQALESRAVSLAMSAPSRDERRRARRFLDAFGAGKSELFR